MFKTIVIASVSLGLAGCLATPQKTKATYRVVPISGATQSMTLQQATIVCEYEANISGNEAATNQEAMNTLNRVGKSSGGAIGGFARGASVAIAKKLAKDDAWKACMARAGFVVE